MLRSLLLVLLACASLSLADPIADLSAANNQFALALFHELAKSDSGNIVISPYSLESALCMTYAGARGETAQQMESVLQIETLGKDVHAAQQDLSGNLRTTCNSDTVAKLAIANALWNAQCTAKPDFTKLVRERYDADVRRLPSDPDTAAQAINAWADLHTEHRIQQVVSPQDLQAVPAALLTNAVYFLGRWQYPFQAMSTTARTFWISRTDTIRVPMMDREAGYGQYRYAEAKTYQSIELPYKESTAVMDVFLPRERDGLKALERSLTAEWLDRQIREMIPSPKEIDLELPRVHSVGNWLLNNALANMGMPMAFGDSADFSGMCPKTWIDKVIHATFLQIDELGTEAAAVTVIMMATSAREEKPIEFHADHPFLFVIRDTATNTILFIGHIVNPRT